MNKAPRKNTVIYRAKSGAIELRGDFTRETIWATQAQMAEIFGVNPQAVTKHIRNIYRENELSRVSTCSKMEQVRIEGETNYPEIPDSSKKEGELKRDSVVAFFATVQKEEKTRNIRKKQEKQCAKFAHTAADGKTYLRNNLKTLNYAT